MDELNTRKVNLVGRSRLKISSEHRILSGVQERIPGTYENLVLCVCACVCALTHMCTYEIKCAFHVGGPLAIVVQ